MEADVLVGESARHRHGVSGPRSRWRRGSCLRRNAPFGSGGGRSGMLGCVSCSQ